MVEHLVCNQAVVGSNPVASTKRDSRPCAPANSGGWLVLPARQIKGFLKTAACVSLPGRVRGVL